MSSCNSKSDQACSNGPPLQKQIEFKLLSSIVRVISVTVDYRLCRIGSMDSTTVGQVCSMAKPGPLLISTAALEGGKKKENIHFAKAENTYENGGNVLGAV